MNTFSAKTQQKILEGLPKARINPTYFSERFRFIIAHTPEEKQRAFLLRHEVFHEELHYNIGDKTNEPLEKDSHDQHSILCLLQHKESGMDAGCLRVVIIENNAKTSENILPLEEYCRSSLMESHLHPSKFPKSDICEVSRLAVHPSFRKGARPPTGLKGEDINRELLESEKKQPTLIVLSLFLAATAIVGLSQRRHVFAMVEPKFNRLLKASGLNFQKAGKDINYCGIRSAYYIDQKKAEENLPEELINFYQHIKKEISQKLHKEIAHDHI